MNGYVEYFRASHMRSLRSHLPDDLYGHLAGSSGSETLLLLAVAAIQSGASLAGALRRVGDVALEAVQAKSHAALLTMVLPDGDGITVLYHGLGDHHKLSLSRPRPSDCTRRYTAGF